MGVRNKGTDTGKYLSRNPSFAFWEMVILKGYNKTVCNPVLLLFDSFLRTKEKGYTLMGKDKNQCQNRWG